MWDRRTRSHFSKAMASSNQYETHASMASRPLTAFRRRYPNISCTPSPRVVLLPRDPVEPPAPERNVQPVPPPSTLRGAATSLQLCSSAVPEAPGKDFHAAVRLAVSRGGRLDDSPDQIYQLLSHVAELPPLGPACSEAGLSQLSDGVQTLLNELGHPESSTILGWVGLPQRCAFQLCGRRRKRFKHRDQERESRRHWFCMPACKASSQLG